MILKLVVSLLIIGFVIVSVLRPKAAYLLSVVFLFNGFGFISLIIKTGNSIDFAYILILIFTISISIKNQRIISPDRFYHKDLLSKVFIVFTLFVVLEYFYTVLRYDQSPYLTFSIGRQYIGFMFFFPTVLFMNLSDIDIDKYFKIILTIGIISSFTYVIASLFDVYFLDFLFRYDKQEVGFDYLSTISVKRVYGGIIYPVYHVGGSLFAYLIYNKIIKKKLLYWLFLVLISFSVFLSLGRGFITSYVVTILIIFIYSQKARYKKIIFIILLAAFSFLLSSAISYIVYDDTLYFADLFTSRILQGEDDLTSSSGTYKVREDIVADRWRLVEENPIIGAGLIHPASGLYGELDGIIGTGHQGYIQIFAQFGYTGFILFVIITLLIFRSAYKVTKLNVPFYFKALALATMGSVVAGYFNMLSTSAFISAQSISLMGILSGIFYYCEHKYPKEINKESNNDQHNNSNV